MTVEALRVGHGVILLGDLPDGHADFLEGVASLVMAVLPRLGHGGARRSHDRSSELGIAWTAHELKGPLLGARAALELVTENPSGDERS